MSLAPRFSRSSRTQSDDTTGARVSTAAYDSPANGLLKRATVDPGGLGLVTAYTYEAPAGPETYMRPTSKALASVATSLCAVARTGSDRKEVGVAAVAKPSDRTGPWRNGARTRHDDARWIEHPEYELGAGVEVLFELLQHSRVRVRSRRLLGPGHPHPQLGKADDKGVHESIQVARAPAPELDQAGREGAGKYSHRRV